MRLMRDRVRRYTYEDQWGDVIEYRHGTTTERKYIQSKGNVALQNNIMISILNSVVGLYTNGTPKLRIHTMSFNGSNEVLQD
jgi:hypothetical protein